MKYERPAIIELGNVAELTAGGRSFWQESMAETCRGQNDPHNHCLPTPMSY